MYLLHSACGVLQTAWAVTDNPQFFMIINDILQFSGEGFSFICWNINRLMAFNIQASLAQMESVFSQIAGLANFSNDYFSIGALWLSLVKDTECGINFGLGFIKICRCNFL